MKFIEESFPLTLCNHPGSQRHLKDCIFLPLPGSPSVSRTFKRVHRAMEQLNQPSSPPALIPIDYNLEKGFNQLLGMMSRLRGRP